VTYSLKPGLFLGEAEGRPRRKKDKKKGEGNPQKKEEIAKGN